MIKKYVFPKEIVVVEKGEAEALGELYERVKENKDLRDYLKTAKLMTEDRMVDLSIIYGQKTCTLMCWLIQNGKLDDVKKVKKSNAK